MLGLPKTNILFGTVTIYSVCIVLGILLALYFAYKEEKRLQLPKDTVLDCALLMLPCGIIGARVYFVLFSWPTFAATPHKIFYIWEGGLGIYGGLMAGAFALYLLSKKKKLSFLMLLDLFIPGVALAQSIGRWGNYFNMEAYGSVVSNPSFQFFPFAVPILQNGTLSWHLATFFYESCVTFFLFLLLHFLQKRKKFHGEIFSWYVLLYGTGRTVIEGLRSDSLFTLGGTFRISQVVGLVSCLLTIFFLYYQTLKKNSFAFFPFLFVLVPSLYVSAGLIDFWLFDYLHASSFSQGVISSLFLLLILFLCFKRKKIPLPPFKRFIPIIIQCFLMIGYHGLSLHPTQSLWSSTLFVFLSMAFFPCLGFLLTFSSVSIKEIHNA